MFATACGDYYQAGWPCVIPVPPDTKYPPPAGFTGAAGADTTPAQLIEWAGTMGDWSVALRMPDGIIGIDVDQYEKHGQQKNGAATLAAKVAAWGELPDTWSSTARGPGQPSRIMFFRVPSGRYAALLGPDVEIIQRHHRYAVVAPSPHHDAGSHYAWYDPSGREADRVPSPSELAQLPARWVAGLAEGAVASSPAMSDRSDGASMLTELEAEDGLRCIEMTTAVTNAMAGCADSTPGSRHDLMTNHVYHIVMLGAEGHPGVGSAIDELRAGWAGLVSGEPGRAGEFENMLLTAARKAVTKMGGTRTTHDPCTGMFGLTPYLAPSPGAAGGSGNEPPIEPEREWSPYMAIGGHEFAPNALSDTLLGRAVLERTWPVLRYCPDAGAWIVKGPEHWTVRKGELAKWAVSLMYLLMQRGDPDADPTTVAGMEQVTLAKRYAKFTTNATAGAIAGQMTAQVTGGYHPCAIDLADLDQDHEILWAGGMAYDLRRSATGPVFASVDPNVPHVHSAAVTPEMRATPLWDAFLAAVWPDPEVRAWALRVLGVTLTGYADKALPILLGPTNRGKTQVIALLMSVLGSYAHAADPRLLSPADRSHASIVYALKGRRLSFIDEAPKSSAQAQERLKQITGGAELTGNRMGENPVTFLPTHTLILTANPGSEPKLTDGAVRSRTRLIPCEGDADAVADARAAIGSLNSPQWRAEAPGVLAKMMTEAARWLADTKSASTERGPQVVQLISEDVAAGQDLIGDWAHSECEPWEPGTKASDLYKEFVAHCRQMGLSPHEIPSLTAWGLRLNELGYPPKKTKKHNLRLLRIARPGASSWTPPEPGAFMEGSVDGRGGSEPPTVHPQNPRSNYPQLSMVEGMEGTQPVITDTHTHTRTQGNASLLPPSPPPTSLRAETPLQAESPASPVSSLSVTSEVPPQTGFPGVVFDLETGDGDQLFTYTAHDDTGFVRLAGLQGSTGPAHILTGDDLVRELSCNDKPISGHNILGFDLLALAWHHGADYDQLAAKAVDTEILARQADPPRSRESGSSEDRYSLDAIAEKLGVGGKTDDINRLKRKFKGYDRIPLDDPEYRSYLHGDLTASAAVLARLPRDPYTDREHVLAALAGRMTLNGFAVDEPLLRQRYAEGQQTKADALAVLNKVWGLPVDKTLLKGRGKDRHEVTEPLGNPLAADSGRAWLEGIWQRYGLVDPPRTGKAGKLATGADDLAAVAANPNCPAELKTVIRLIGIVVGTRTVYQTAMDYLAADGRVHPRISFRQASGRWSVTQPGLTVFGKRDGRHAERDIFLPDDGHVLVSFDLAQVDMRSMAGHCQDPAYMAIFQDRERDAHTEIGALVGLSRQDAKKIGHGWNYGLGRNRMIRDGLDPVKVDQFIGGMQARFPGLIAWRETIREMGKRGEILDNGFGRKMRCDEARAYTVAPALMGQGGARDLMCESLLRLPREYWPFLRVMVHDEIVCSIPKDIVADVSAGIMNAFTWTWRDVPIYPDMSAGLTWGQASAK